MANLERELRVLAEIFYDMFQDLPASERELWQKDPAKAIEIERLAHEEWLRQNRVVTKKRKAKSEIAKGLK